MQDVESELGMTRDKLIQLALLLGSDYTEGVAGIGIVNAVEIVNAFPTEELLVNFRYLAAMLCHHCYLRHVLCGPPLVRRKKMDRVHEGRHQAALRACSRPCRPP